MNKIIFSALLFLFAGVSFAQNTDSIHYNKIENPAHFPGGEVAMMNFIRANITYPDSSKDAGIQGKVYVEFIITETGEVTEVKIKRGIDPLLDEEAIRVIKMMPYWIPAQINGQNVSCRFVLPITFRLH